MVQEAQSIQQTAEVRKQRTRLATAKQRVSELEVLLCKIYEDNILGKLSDRRYATLDAQYEKEQSELTAEISVLEKAVKSYEKHEKDADRFIALIDKYENFDKLTIAMLNEFIEKSLCMSVTAKAVYRPHRGRDLLQFCRVFRSPGVWRSGTDPGGIRGNPQA